MSMRPSPIEPVPAETVRIARAAFRKGNLLMRIRDEIGILYDDQMFARLYDARGQLAISPWRLALVTVFQFLENLSDRQAAEAVRSRIDLKYALSLELDDPGFDFSVLCEFRAACLPAGPIRTCLKSCWSTCTSAAWSRPTASSAPTPPMFWPRSAASTVWNSSARRCVPPSTPSQRPLRSG